MSPLTDEFLKKIYKEIGESDANQDVSDWLSTGFLPLNKTISGRYDGGFPVGRISELYGGESSGKTLLATMAMIETQKKGGLALKLDYEHAFSLRRAIQLGLDPDPKKWIYKQPETAEQGFQIIEFVANAVRQAGNPMFITCVIDSVAAMQTEEELKAGYDEATMKTRLSLAACLSTSLKKISALVNKTNITLLFLNQTRSNVGVLYGDKEKTVGGNALKFYASVRAKLAKQGKIKDEENKELIIGENVAAQIIKNKVWEPWRTCEWVTHFTEGINLELSHMNFAKEIGMLGDTKGYLEFDGKKYRAKDLEQTLKKDREMYARFLQEIIELDAA